MIINCRTLRKAGLIADWKERDEVLVIHGKEPWSDKANNAIDILSGELDFSPPQRDQLADYCADVQVWTLVKRLSE